jgi:hypothetical protein
MVARKKIGVLCLAVMLAFALSATTMAGAKKRHKRPPKQVGSQIALDSVGPNGAEGHVSSPRAACLADRAVTLYMVGSDSTLRTSDAVATTRTRGDGSWSAALFAGHSLYPGKYYAVVWRNVIEKKRTRVACVDATSGDKTF